MAYLNANIPPIECFVRGNYLRNQEDSFEKVNLEFCKLRDGLTQYTNKENWIKKIWNLF